MHLKNQRPIFVPWEFVPALENLSKAALMDLVWDFATTAGEDDKKETIMNEIRARADIVLMHRKSAKAEGRS